MNQMTLCTTQIICQTCIHVIRLHLSVHEAKYTSLSKAQGESQMC